MNARARSFCYLFAFICATSMLSGCGEQRGSIEGKVFDRNGEPVAGMLIRAESVSYPAVLFRSDDDGFYNINGLPCGLWDMKFYNDTGVLIGIEPAMVAAGESYTVDFRVGAKPPPCYSEVISNPP